MGAYDTPTQPCPYCNALMDADWVDVGVGMVQCGPYHCWECGASEIGPERSTYETHRFDGEWDYVNISIGTQKEIDDKLGLDEDERRTGFYKRKISPHCNQIGGKPIDYKTADSIYRAEYFRENGNPYNAPIERYKK